MPDFTITVSTNDAKIIQKVAAQTSRTPRELIEYHICSVRLAGAHNQSFSRCGATPHSCSDECRWNGQDGFKPISG